MDMSYETQLHYMDMSYEPQLTFCKTGPGKLTQEVGKLRHLSRSLCDVKAMPHGTRLPSMRLAKRCTADASTAARN